MIWFYRLLFPVLFLIGLPYYLSRTLRRGGYGERFWDRFGFPPYPEQKRSGPTVWIQAVSVGEVLAIEAVISKLRKTNPNLKIILTTTTSTGFKLAREKISTVDLVAYFPLDFWPVSQRVWNRFRPDFCLLMEGELWPEHLHQAKKRKVPVFLVNARLSDRSYRRYQKSGYLGRWLFRSLSGIVASSEEDAERLRNVGGPDCPVSVSGNLKLDVEFPPKSTGDARKAEFFKQGLTADKEDELPLLLLGSSTWPGEEEVLCQAFREILEHKIPARLVIIPRHAEKRQQVIEAIQSNGFELSTRSVDGPCAEGRSIYLADTTGELRYFTSLADLAFIGKSLTPHEGGQTPIEAGAYGIPMVYGPHMSNFKAACRGLEEKGAAIRTETAEDTKKSLLALALDKTRRERMREASLAWHCENRGSVDRLVNVLLEEISKLDR